MPTKPQLFPRSAGLLGLAFALGGLAATAAAQDDLAGSLFLPGAPPAIDSIFSDASPVAPTNLAGSPPPGETPPAVVGYPPSSAETLPLVEPPAAEGLVFLTKQGTPPPEPVEAKPEKQPLTGFFDDGFKFESTDGEFQLQIHNETQLDLRAYAEKLDPVDQFGFTVPRMRLIFNGHLTKPIEYNVSINKGLGSLDLLDAFFNFNYDPRFQVRIGRFRAPFTYDWYALSNQFLLTPERSIFAINYGYNRNVGGMIHGEVLDERLDYAVAVVNGPRNSYIDENAAKDVLGYVNVRPFGQSESFPFLHNLNLGGSVAYGEQDQFPNPIAFRTSAAASTSLGTAESVPAFLELDGDVTETGLREMWELQAAYYYKSLSLIGAWDSGFHDYASTTGPSRVHLPTSGYHMQFGYFLTGEEITKRALVTPLRPFDLRADNRGFGAIEAQTRFAHFQVGDEVFTGGLANPAIWTNSVSTIDSGFNWYLTRQVKIYFDWQHAMYASPVQFRPGRTETTSNLFWLRTQLYF